jgi:O-acetylserine/cysteine efflux transporter
MSLRLGDLALVLLVMVVWGVNFVVAKVGMTEFPPMMIIGLRFAVAAALLLPFAPLPPRRLTALLALAFMLGPVHFSMMYLGIRGTDASLAAVLGQLHVPFAALLAFLLLGDRMSPAHAVGILIAFAGAALIAGAPKDSSELVSVLLIIAGTFSWAVTNIQVKKMGGADPVAITAWSAALGVPMMALLSLLFERDHLTTLREAGWRGWGSVVFMGGLVSALGYVVWYRLLSRYPVSLVSPFALLVPIFGVIAGVLWLSESLSWADWLGSALTVGGLAVIVLRRQPKPAAAGNT